jgi:hypothetical protein
MPTRLQRGRSSGADQPEINADPRYLRLGTTIGQTGTVASKNVPSAMVPANRSSTSDLDERRWGLPAERSAAAHGFGRSAF